MYVLNNGFLRQSFSVPFINLTQKAAPKKVPNTSYALQSPFGKKKIVSSLSLYGNPKSA